MSAGSRPERATHLGRDPEVARLCTRRGNGRSGILLAALTGEITGDLLTSGIPDVDIAS